MMQSGDLHTLDAWLSRARVLLVDDQPANLTFLRHVLESERYGELLTVSDPADALDRFHELAPDMVIVDLWMGRLDGFDFITRVQQMLPPGSYLPVLVATGDHTPEARRRALSVGARDFLTKPLSPAEVRLRVRNLLETRFLHERLREQNAQLEDRVTQRTHELEEARLEMLNRLARAAEFRDDESGQHTLRVGRIAGRIAQVLGVDPEIQELITRAAPLHDIGKIGIPDSILLKKGSLDPDERAIIRTHTVIGAEILSGSRYALLQLAEEIALSHHEHWDGRGYPHGLAREDIPLAGRIVAVADVFDALTHDRPYKRAWSVREALTEIEANAGTQFEPAVVEAMLRIAPETAMLETQRGPTRRATASRATARAVPRPVPPDVPIPAAPRAPARHAPPADSSTLGELRLVQAERDALARELAELRQHIARRENVIVRVRRWAQPN